MQGSICSLTQWTDATTLCDCSQYPSSSPTITQTHPIAPRPLTTFLQVVKLHSQIVTLFGFGHVFFSDALRVDCYIAGGVAYL